MNKSFWVLTNTSTTNLSILGTNIDIPHQVNNPYIPNYMKPSYTKQIGFAFVKKNNAVDFSDVDIHKKKIVRCSSNELVYTKANVYDLPDYSLYPINIIEPNSEDTNTFLTKLVVSTMIHFFVINNIFESDRFLTLQGFFIDPTPQIEEEHVELFMEMLENNYLKNDC